MQQLTLTDIADSIHVIHMQKDSLEFFSYTDNMPPSSHWSGVLKLTATLGPILRSHIAQCESDLHTLLERVDALGLGGGVRRWLEGEADESYFKFEVDEDGEIASILKVRVKY